MQLCYHNIFLPFVIVIRLEEVQIMVDTIVNKFTWDMYNGIANTSWFIQDKKLHLIPYFLFKILIVCIDKCLNNTS